MSSTGRARLNSVIVKSAISPPRPRTRRRRSRNQGSGGAANPGNTLFVTGLTRRITMSELYNYFSSVGKVKRCHVLRDHHTRRSLGYGFVTLETIEEAERCIKYLDRSFFDDQLISVEKANRSRGFNPSRNKRERRRWRRRYPSPYTDKKRWQEWDRGYYSRDWQRRSPSPSNKKRSRMDDYPDSCNKSRRTDDYSGSSYKRRRVG